jgi:hypothetical protein
LVLQSAVKIKKLLGQAVCAAPTPREKTLKKILKSFFFLVEQGLCRRSWACFIWKIWIDSGGKIFELLSKTIYNESNKGF